MDYREKYEEALERARQIHNEGKAQCFDVMTKVFPELVEVDDWKIRKWLINLVKSHIRWLEDRIKEQLSNGQIYGEELSKAQISLAWLEKQNKQTFVDNVEPKFKVGDWITDNNSTFQIVRVENEWYYADDGDKICFDVAHQYYHLWTIKDAKPGDVLATKFGRPFIFKDFSDVKHPNNPTAYCGINTLDDFIISSGTCWWTDEEVYPATKEQCNLLFQKIKESGYEWKNNRLEKIDNEDYVDLGLPSGTLWTKCNLGAEKETDFGLFFQWGDTQGYEDASEHQFSWSDYKWGNYDNLTKYNDLDEKIVLDNEDDPVFVTSKGKLKLPTKEQLQELIDCTNHEWTIIDGVKGMKFISKNDDTKYIFIPAAGEYASSSHEGEGSWGCVWSASRDESYACYAWGMYFEEEDVELYYSSRCYGFSVRGVK